MTNVKLKLMFYLLNALLTADIVHSRPYSNRNDSQPYSNTNSQYTGNINSHPYSNSQRYSGNTDSQPYSNSQTYSGNANSQYTGNSNSQLYAGSSNSQYSDNSNSQFSGNTNQRSYPDNTTDIVIKFPTNNTFNLPVDPNSDTLVVANDDDETAEETNISSNSNMEAIVNAEQDRDEGISVNRARPQPKDLPKDDKQLNISSSLLEDIIDSETDREESITDILFKPESEFIEIPKFEFLIAAKINESDGGLKNDSDDKISSDVLKKVDYVELVEVGKIVGGNSSAYMLNITGHEVDNDLAPDTRFTDVQTWFLACFGTLLPLLALLFGILFIRCLCRRYCPGFCKKPSTSSASDSSEKPDANHHHLKLPTEEGTSVSDGDTPASNGSIFTMTLKNNHLIVETEERNDMTKNCRETKMKYSPDNDGIFVVEVQQSSAYRHTNKSALNSSPRDPEIATNLALIHRVPDEIADSESSRFEREKALALSSTGLSISDLSMSSIGSHNVSYSYSSQMGYEQGPFGYPVYAGYDVNKDDTQEGIITDDSQEPLICKTPADPDKPVVTAAIFKQDSIIGSDVLQGPGYCIEGSTDGPLLSDVQAREYSLHHLQEQKKIENGVAVPIPEKIESPKKTLNRADSLPVRLEDDKMPEPEVTVMETIKEDDPPTKDMLKGKRASLPIIRTEMYESVKDAILPTDSTKFTELFNDSSPAESSFDSPPMITITEESESSKSEAS